MRRRSDSEAGPDFPDLFYAYDATGGQSLTGTAVTVNLNQNPAAPDRYSPAADVVTFGAAWPLPGRRRAHRH